MLGNVVVKFMTKYLSEYIETLDKSQMEMEIWKGQATFEDLVILPTAFSTHLLPFVVKKGIIKNVKLNFPWKKLSSEPCVVEISDVYILLNLDLEVLIKKDLQAKQSAIHKEELMTKEEEKGTWNSLLTNIYENLKINIKNIHIRLEIKHECAIYSFGLIMNDVSFLTVDDKEKSVSNSSSNDCLRKKFKFDLSLYFDTIYMDGIDLDNFINSMKEQMKSKDHQFILKTFSFECLLSHYKSTEDITKNIFEMFLPPLEFSLDLLQCRAIDYITQQTKIFSRRRRYASCIRPKGVFNEINHWNYYTRCAILRKRPHEFNPHLALTILKNRKEFLKLYRKKNQRGMMHPISNFNYKSLKKSIGSEATLFLKEYSRALIKKEINSKNSGLTTLDLTKLKEMSKSSKIHDFLSFSLNATLQSFKVVLKYSERAPLCIFELLKLNTIMERTEECFKTQFKINNLVMEAIINDITRKIIDVNLLKNESFMKIEYIIPLSMERSSINIQISSISALFEKESVHNIIEFFRFDHQSLFNNIMVQRLFLSEKLHSLLYLKNCNVKFKILGLSIIYPFIYKNEKTNLNMSFGPLSIKNTSKEHIPYNNPSVQLDFKSNITFEGLNFNNSPVIEKFHVKLNLKTIYLKKTKHFSFNLQENTNDISINLKSSFFDFFLNALRYFDYSGLRENSNRSLINSQEIIETKSRYKKVIISMENIDFEFKFNLSKLNLKANEFNSLFIVNNAQAIYSFKNDSKLIQIFSDNLSFFENEQILFDVPKNNIKIILDHEDTSKSDTKIMIQNMIFDLKFNKLQKMIQKYQNIFSDYISNIIKTNLLIQQELNKINIVKVPNKNINKIKLEFPGFITKISSEKDCCFVEIENIIIEEKIKILNLILKRENRILAKLCSFVLEKNLENIIFPLVELDIDYSDIFFIIDIGEKISLMIPHYDKQNSSKLSLEFSIINILISNQLLIGYFNLNNIILKISEDSSMEIKINDFNAYQVINKMFFPLLRIDKQLYIWIDKFKTNINIELPLIDFYFSPSFIKFIPLINENNKKTVSRDISLHLSLEGINIHLINKIEEILEINISKSNVLYSKIKDVDELDLHLSSVEAKSQMIRDIFLLKLPNGFNFNIHDYLMKSEIDSVSFTFYLPLIMKIQSCFNLLFPEDTNDSLKIKNNFEFSIKEIELKFIPCNLYGEYIYTIFNNIRLVLDHIKQFGGLSIEKIQSYLENSVNRKCVNILNIISIFSFNKENVVCRETINSLNNIIFSKSSIPIEIKKMFLNLKIEKLKFIYTHLFANAIINCFLVKQTILPNYEMKIVKPDEKLTNNMNNKLFDNVFNFQKSDKSIIKHNDTEISLIFSIKELSISMFLFNEIAQFKFSSIKGFLNNNKFNGSIKTFDIYGFGDNKSYVYLPNSDFVNCMFENNTCSIIFGDFSIDVDFKFYTTIINYFIRSPFINLSYKDSSKLSLPIIFKLKITNVNIKIPTFIERFPILNIDLNFEVKISKTELQLDLLKSSAYFSYQKFKYLPIFKDISLFISKNITENSSIDLTINLDSIYIILSPIDFILFNSINKNIKKEIEIITFIEQPNINDNKINISSFKFNVKKIKIIICSDNKSSSLFTPQFKFILPSINIFLNDDDSINSISTKISPCIKFYNEKTCNWDLILEPFSLLVNIILSNKKLEITAESTNSFNINIPTFAINQYLTLANNIKQMLTVPDFQHSQNPNIWILNSLGDNISVSANNNNTIVSDKQLKPIFGTNENTKIIVSYENNDYCISKNLIIYTTLLGSNILVAKSLYKGGILFHLKPPIEIRNSLIFPIDVYRRTDSKQEFSFLTTIQPNLNYPLNIQKDEFIFKKYKSCLTNDRQFIVKLKNKSSKNDIFPITVDEYNYNAMILSRFVNSTHIFDITAPYIITSLLPIPIHVKIKEMKGIILLNPEEETPFLLNNKFSCCLSLDGFNFGEYERINIGTKVQILKCYNYWSDCISNIAISFVLDEERNQTIVSFYAPCVIFNNTKSKITIYDSDESIVSNSGIFSIWCPKSYLSNKEHLIANLAIDDAEPIKNIDFLVTRRTIQNFSITKQEKYKICIDVSVSKNISVVTLSNVLIIHNLLNFDLNIQPIDGNVRTNFVGEPYLIKSQSSSTITKMSDTGTFIISGFTTTPILYLLSEFKNAFKIQSNESKKIIFLEIVDVKTHLDAYFKPIQFPSPILIANCLNTKLIAYHLIQTTFFEIEPNSTSIFAFDEPFSYPSLTIEFNDQKLYLSLVNDTEFYETNALFNKEKVYVGINKTIYGQQIVNITTKLPEKIDYFNFSSSLILKNIFISIIDIDMNEFALLSIDNLKFSFDSNDDKILKFSVDSIQLDDQSPQVPNPVILSCPKSEDKPFFDLECVISQDWLDVLYCSGRFQTIYIEIDSSMISDLFYLSNELIKPIKRTIAPLESTKIEESSKVISWNWLEMTPISICLKYNRKGKRETTIHKILPYVKYIPTMNENNILLPGVIITNLQDNIKDIFSTVSIEYKTAAFNQILKMLGTGGKLMSTLGITSLISELLDIKMESDLTSDITQFLGKTLEEFENRHEVNGLLSHQSLNSIVKIIEQLNLNVSDIIIKLINHNDIGLQNKIINGKGFRNGILGLLIPEYVNNHENKIQNIIDNKKRSSRAFYDNRISIYNETISKYQNIMQKKFRNEKFKLYINDTTFATDNFIIIFTDDNNYIKKDIITIKETTICSGNIVVIKYQSDEIKIITQSEERAKAVQAFISSQSNILRIFN